MTSLTTTGLRTTATQSLGSAAPQRKTRTSMVHLAMVALLVFLFLTASGVITVYVVAQLSSHPGTEGKDSNGNGDELPPFETDRPPVVVISEAPTAAPTTSYTTVRTTSPTTQPVSSSVLPPMGPEILLCTYGPRTTSGEVMASDGVCDVAFYDSIYAGNRNYLTGGKPFELDLRTFMRVGAAYSRTTLGVAFAYEHMSRLKNDLQRTEPHPLDVFWHRKIFHAGVVNTPADGTRTGVIDAISQLKVLDAHLEAQRSRGYSALTALAGPSPDKQWMDFLAEQFKKVQYSPDLLIVNGHFQFGDNTIKGCAVMPPTLPPSFNIPAELRGSYSFDLSVGLHNAADLEKRHVRSLALLSVTMKGRWTTVGPQQTQEFFARCEYNPSAVSFGSYTQVCKDGIYSSNLKYQPRQRAMLTYDATSRRVFAYDNEQGLVEKLCKVKYETRHVTFGIAAYDIDYDDYADECASTNKFGSHSRLKALRTVVDYYRSSAGKIFNEATCTSAVS